VPTAATFASLTPGASSSSAGGTLTAVNTSPSWQISAKDGGTSGDGRMDKDGAVPACATSAPDLANPVSLSVVPAVTNNATTSTTRNLSGTDQVVAQATLVPLAATVFNTNSSQTVGSAEALATGCVYKLTTTYTLQ
jgi:hypothetical protein